MVSWRLRSKAEINNHQTLSTSFTVETVVMEFSSSHFFHWSQQKHQSQATINTKNYKIAYVFVSVFVLYVTGTEATPLTNWKASFVRAFHKCDTDSTQSCCRYVEHNLFTQTQTHTHTHPCCVLSQVAATVLNSVGVAQLLEELHFLDDILPFLEQKQRHNHWWADLTNWSYV